MEVTPVPYNLNIMLKAVDGSRHRMHFILDFVVPTFNWNKKQSNTQV